MSTCRLTLAFTASVVAIRALHLGLLSLSVLSGQLPRPRLVLLLFVVVVGLGSRAAPP